MNWWLRLLVRLLAHLRPRLRPRLPLRPRLRLRRYPCYSGRRHRLHLYQKPLSAVAVSRIPAHFAHHQWTCGAVTSQDCEQPLSPRSITVRGRSARRRLSAGALYFAFAPESQNGVCVRRVARSVCEGVCVRASGVLFKAGAPGCDSRCGASGVGGESAETTVIRPRGIQNIRLLRLLRPRKQVRELPCVLRAAVLACCDRYP